MSNSDLPLASGQTPFPFISAFTKVESEAKKIINFGLSHLILLVLLFVAIFGASYFYTSKRAEVAELRAEASAALAKQADANNVAFQLATKQEIGALKQQNLALTTQVATLAGAIARRDAALQTRKVEIKQLPPTQLATQWGSAAHEPAPTVSTDGNLLTPLPLAQKSLIALEEVPVLQKDKGDLQQSLGIQTQATLNSDAARTREEQAHLSDNLTCKADKTALTDQIDKVKKEATRGKLRTFLYGVGVGIGATVFTVARYF